MPLALALDLGTTSIAAAAVSPDGRLVAHEQLSNDAAVTGLPAGHTEQNPLRIREITCEVLRRLAGQLNDTPVCLGITGQMHGGLVVDVHRRPVTNLITWQDRRANLPASPGSRTWLQLLLEKCPADELISTGCRPAAGFFAVTLFVLAQQGKRFVDSGARAACVADWIAAELTDGPIVTDPGDAASWGVYDLERRAWNRALLETCGLSCELMPEVRESGAVLGGLTRAMADVTGLPEGLPVSNAIGDNQAAVLGSVPAGSPAIQINVGTGGQINWPVDRFVRQEGMETRYLPVGRLMLVGPGLSGGDAYAWVNRTAAKWLAVFGVERTSDEIYARMNELAAAIPDTDDTLVCAPLFRGTRWKPGARGEFHNVTFDNFSPGHVARAVLRGIAQGMYSFYEGAGSSRPERLDRIIGSGNGLRKNPLLVRAISQQFNRPVWFPAHTQEAAYGAALLAGASTGLWSNLEAAGRNIQLVQAATVPFGGEPETRD
jgi:sugar (pentulose or hexulose) kinase